MKKICSVLVLMVVIDVLFARQTFAGHDSATALHNFPTGWSLTWEYVVKTPGEEYQGPLIIRKYESRGGWQAEYYRIGEHDSLCDEAVKIIQPLKPPRVTDFGNGMTMTEIKPNERHYFVRYNSNSLWKEAKSFSVEVLPKTGEAAGIRFRLDDLM